MCAAGALKECRCLCKRSRLKPHSDSTDGPNGTADAFLSQWYRQDLARREDSSAIAHHLSVCWPICRSSFGLRPTRQRRSCGPVRINRIVIVGVRLGRMSNTYFADNGIRTRQIGYDGRRPTRSLPIEWRCVSLPVVEVARSMAGQPQQIERPTFAHRQSRPPSAVVVGAKRHRRRPPCP
jgi:hypothetical protein